jgi:signal transduction histidine kinase/CheY-like chemotaxis protein
MKFLRLNLQGLTPTDRAIYLEQLRDHWRLDVWAIPGQFIALLALIPVVQRSGLRLWEWGPPIALLLATWAWGSLSIWRLRRVVLDADNYPRWRAITLMREVTQATGWALLAAMLWGALPSQWHLLILTALIIFGYTAMFFSTHDSGVATAANLPILLIVLARLLLDPAEGTATIALILTLSMVTCLGVGRLIEVRLLEAERLRIRNEQLVAELADEVGKVRLAKEAAEQANRQKSEFIATASHDVRQPLHSLTLLSGLLTSRLQEPDARGLAGKISAAVDGLRGIFEQLFDIARVDAQKLVHQPHAIALRPLLSQLADEFELLCQDKGLRWQHLHAQGVPAHTLVQADPLFMQRILRNLLENALRYTPPGQTVRLRTRARGPWLVVQVWDQGPGIAPADRARIFEDYVQLHNPARHLREGLGLGLGLVRRLVQAGAYRLTVHSRLGQGSVFSLWVPLVPVTEATAPTPEATPLHDPHALPGQGATRTMLLVEDDDDVRDTTRTVLQALGWQCFAGATLAQAIEALARADAWPQALLTDLRLGAGDDGLAVARQARHEFGPELPVLLLTGDLDPTLNARAAEAGVVLRRKPLSPAELRQALDTLIGGPA